MVATGLGFPEGPAALPNGDLVVTDMRFQSVFLISDDGASLLARLPGSPNGAVLGEDGWLYLANNGGLAPDSSETVWFARDLPDGAIQRLSLSGVVEMVDTGPLPAAAPHRPNDLCFGPDGRLYFTDPHNWEVLQSKTPDERTYGGGRVCRTDLRGSTEMVADLAGFPNGLAFTPDSSELIVAQTIHHRLVAIAASDRASSRPREYCRLPPTVNPDGICFDAEGNLYVAGSAGDTLAVVGSDGRVEDVLDLPAGSCPTNVCLQGGRLWVTLGLAGAVGYFDTPSVALPLLPGGQQPSQR